MAAAAAATPAVSVVGTWTGKDANGAEGSYIFMADGTADVITDGKSLKQTVVKDQGTITYRLDTSVTPHALDIVMLRNDGESRTMLYIVEFTSADTMRVRRPGKSGRPLDFAGPANETMLVKRQAAPKK